MFLEILAILALVLTNGFFVAAEFAIVKVRSTQIETLSKENPRLAKIAKHVTSHLDVYLSTSQLGVTIASIALGWIGEPVMSRLVEPVINFLGIGDDRMIHAVSFILGFSMITFLHITLGEQAPKYAAIQYPKTFTLGVALPLRLFYMVFRPFIYILNSSANLMLRVVGINPTGEKSLAHSEEEIRLLIADGQKTGVIDATEYKLIENIFDFTETTVREIMVPRTDVFALDIAEPFEKNRKLAIDSGYSRIPVYRETIDSVIGILYMKDLFKMDQADPSNRLEQILRPVYFAPEMISINRLMQDFLKQKVHFGVITDEFGGTSGIVTLEDIIEKIVGQIQDEYDDEQKEIEALTDGSYLVSPKIRINAFNKYFGCDIADDEHYQTLAGFLNHLAGHIPNLSETMHFGGLVFTITKKNAKRIQQVKVHREKSSVSN